MAEENHEEERAEEEPGEDRDDERWYDDVPTYGFRIALPYCCSIGLRWQW